MRVTNVAGGAELASQLTTDAETVFSGLPANATVAITGTARNAAGESLPSVPVQIAVP